jgi:hypothetical protein
MQYGSRICGPAFQTATPMVDTAVQKPGVPREAYALLLRLRCHWRAPLGWPKI